MNIVCLVGRLTADPECKQTPGGVNVCSFSVAVNRAFSNANGERQADFINCVAWRQTAEFIARYFRKGQNIGLNGTIQTRTYQDKDTGKNRTAFEVVINNAYFVESKANAQQQQPQEMPPVTASAQQVTVAQQSFVQQTQRKDLFPSADGLDDFIYTDNGDLPF